MSAAFLLVIGLIGISPALLVIDGLIVHALITAATALGVIIVALSIRPGEGEHLAKIFRPVAALALIPALLMLLQLAPIPGLIHPLWASAREALDASLAGAVTVDRGATLVTFTQWTTAAGLVFAGAAVTIDRARAEATLFALSAVTTLAALALIGLGLSGLRAAGDAAFGSDTTLPALTALGIIVNTAAADRAVERYETRRSSAGGASMFLRALALAVGALAICAAALIAFSSGATQFAAGCGFAAFAIIVVIRRLGLRAWEAALIAVIALVVVGLIAFANWGSGDLTLRFASNAIAVPVAQSMLADTNWFGNGAGSFSSLLPIYRAIDAAELRVPTAAAATAIEMGRITMWLFLALGLGLFALLLRGALTRGRDSFFPTAGTAAALMLMIEAFSDASLFASAVTVIAAATIGLGLGQGESRTAQVRF